MRNEKTWSTLFAGGDAGAQNSSSGVTTIVQGTPVRVPPNAGEPLQQPNPTGGAGDNYFMAFFGWLKTRTALLCLISLLIMHILLTTRGESAWLLAVRPIPVLGQIADLAVATTEWMDAQYKVRVKYAYVPGALSALYESLPSMDTVCTWGSAVADGILAAKALR